MAYISDYMFRLYKEIKKLYNKKMTGLHMSNKQQFAIYSLQFAFVTSSSTHILG